MRPLALVVAVLASGCDRTEPTVILTHPTTNLVVPANLERLYLQFSSPMLPDSFSDESFSFVETETRDAVPASFEYLEFNTGPFLYVYPDDHLASDNGYEFTFFADGALSATPGNLGLPEDATMWFVTDQGDPNVATAFDVFDVSPREGSIDDHTEIVIHGAGLTNVAYVHYANGAYPAFVLLSSERIRVRLGHEAASGPLTLITWSGEVADSPPIVVRP